MPARAKKPGGTPMNASGVRQHVRRQVGVGVRKLAGRARHERRQLRLRLGQGHAPREAAEHVHGVLAGFLRQIGRSERDPDAVRGGKLESLRHHPDHRGRGDAHANDPAEHRSVSTETGLPQTVPKNGHRGGSGLLVRLDQRPSEQRGHARDPEGGGADLGDPHGCARFLTPRQIPLPQPEAADVVHGAEPVLPGQEVVRGREALRAPRVGPSR